MFIRPSQPADLQCLAAIGLRAWQRGISSLVPESTRTRIPMENPFVPFLESVGSEVLVAEYEGTPAGFAACEHADNHITDLWVDPDFEGRGISSALLQALETRIAQRGYDRTLIQVAAENTRALGLYRHLGYSIDWQETRYDPILKTNLAKIGLSRPIQS